MSVARNAVALSSKLRAASMDPFDPQDLQRIGKLPDTSAIETMISADGETTPSDAIRLILQALQVQAEELSPRLATVEFVATVPSGFQAQARGTREVVSEMVAEAKSEVIVLGYEFSDPSFIRELACAAQKGIDIILICDRERGSARRVLSIWPPAVRPPSLFEDRDRPQAAAHASMHAKCILVDSTDLLVTSANFTFHGMQGNIEMGVRLRGFPASSARSIFSDLIVQGFVCPVPQ
jgi:phosphatidylserine/phosphatidylglycerophosphate/cardiolipin synthase-like enzyme